jgi:hypothetical protein
VLFALVALAGGPNGFAEEPETRFGVGVFDVSAHGRLMVQAEHAFGRSWNGVVPQVGILATEESSGYVYGGVGYPLSLGQRWSLLPSFSLGYYHQGAGKDLGNDLEFYTQIRLEYRFESLGQMGLAYGHISNADISDVNPGADILQVTYRFRF